MWLKEFKPMQVARLDLDYYCETRSEFTLLEWRELLVNAEKLNVFIFWTYQAALHLFCTAPNFFP
jgi:predicted ATP-dependent Lon-type protease